jgi:hypothetical protein
MKGAHVDDMKQKYILLMKRHKYKEQNCCLFEMINIKVKIFRKPQ